MSKLKKIPLSQVDLTPEEEFQIVQKWQDERVKKMEEDTRQEEAVLIHEQLESYSFEDKKLILDAVMKLHNQKIDSDISEMERDIKLVEDEIISRAKQKF